MVEIGNKSFTLRFQMGTSDLVTSKASKDMVFPDKRALDAKPRLFRYFFYLISSLRPVRMSVWVTEGEPNPFVRERARSRYTHQQEIKDIFQDSLGRG